MISVVIPFFRSGELLGEAIESVFNQTEKDWELILVDNNASDETRLVAEKYLKKNSDRIRLVHEPRQGNAFARNLGIISAVGDYIAFLDDDDIMYPNRLKLQKSALENQPHASLVFGFVDRVSQDNQKILLHGDQSSSFVHFRKCSPEVQKIVRLNFPDPPPSTFFFSKKILNKTGYFDTHLTPFFGEDTDFCLSMYQNGDFLEVNEPIIRFRMPSSEFLKKKRKKSLSRYRMIKNQDYFYTKVIKHIQKKNLLEDPEIQNALSIWKARWLKELGMSFLGLKNGVSFGRKLLVKSFKENPKDISVLRHFLRSLRSYKKRFLKYGDIQINDEVMEQEIEFLIIENLFTGKHLCEFCELS